MRRDLYHLYSASLEQTFNAYISALTEKPFEKELTIKEYSLISFDLGMSFKFNMNGGCVNIHFFKKGVGTLVQVRYTIVQLFGARYGAYDELLTNRVENILKTKSKSLDKNAADAEINKTNQDEIDPEAVLVVTEDINARMVKAKELYEQNLISEEEYNELRKKILSEI